MRFTTRGAKWKMRNKRQGFVIGVVVLPVVLVVIVISTCMVLRRNGTTAVRVYVSTRGATMSGLSGVFVDLQPHVPQAPHCTLPPPRALAPDPPALQRYDASASALHPDSVPRAEAGGRAAGALPHDGAAAAFARRCRRVRRRGPRGGGRLAGVRGGPPRRVP